MLLWFMPFRARLASFLLLADGEPLSHEPRQLLRPPPQRRDPQSASDLDDDEASGRIGGRQHALLKLVEGVLPGDVGPVHEAVPVAEEVDVRAGEAGAAVWARRKDAAVVG